MLHFANLVRKLLFLISQLACSSIGHFSNADRSALAAAQIRHRLIRRSYRGFPTIMAESAQVRRSGIRPGVVHLGPPNLRAFRHSPIGAPVASRRSEARTGGANQQRLRRFRQPQHKLVDVDGAVVRMRAPLLEIKEKILAFRGSVDGSLAALQSRLKQRAQANEAREVLELLLDTSHVVSKVEKLIKELPTVPADWPSGNMNTAEKGQINNSFQYAENGANLRETQSMLLERIAREMNR